jgi:hypothetical protein
LKRRYFVIKESGGKKDSPAGNKAADDAPAAGNYSKFNYNGEPLPPGVERYSTEFITYGTCIKYFVC